MGRVFEFNCCYGCGLQVCTPCAIYRGSIQCARSKPPSIEFGIGLIDLHWKRAGLITYAHINLDVSKQARRTSNNCCKAHLTTDIMGSDQGT